MYLQVVSTYIHLNPARAGLIRPGQQKLKQYRWSSYPWYLSRKAPQWLCRERVLGSLNLRPEQSRGYAAYLEARVLELGIKAGRKELEKEWEQLRRGWYLGGEKFREELVGRLESAVRGRQRGSHSGPARAAHDQAAAVQPPIADPISGCRVPRHVPERPARKDLPGRRRPPGVFENSRGGLSAEVDGGKTERSRGFHNKNIVSLRRLSTDAALQCPHGCLRPLVR